MKKLLLFAFPFVLVAGQAQAEEKAWTLDKAHSSVGFQVRHMGVSRVNGAFKDFDGTIMADAKSGKVSTIEASVKTASVSTGVDQRDGHLKSDDFFNAEKFPEMKFKSSKVSHKGNKITVEGDLTIRDVTKKVKFEGEYYGVQKFNMGQGDMLSAGYSATTKINRKDFGLKFGAMADKVNVVGDEVTIQLEAEIQQKL